MTSKAFVRANPANHLYALVLKQKALVKILRPIVSSSLEELNRTGALLDNPTTATPTVG